MSESPFPSSCVSTPMECFYSTLDIPDTHCSTGNSPSLSQMVLTHWLSSQLLRWIHHRIPVPTLANLKVPPSSLFTLSCIYLRLETLPGFLCFLSKEFQILINSRWLFKGRYAFPFELFCIKLAFSLLCLRTLVNSTHTYISYISQRLRDMVSLHLMLAEASVSC